VAEPTLLGDPGYWRSGAQLYWDLVRHRIQKGPVFSWRFIGPVPERLTMVPPDLRPTDPLVARDIYEGRFTFSGRVIETGGVSPFAVEAPSAMWEERLHGFRWLRHLKGADSDLASANARALVNDWIITRGRTLAGPAWELPVVAARIISWMQYSRLLLVDSDHGFYRRFMISLSRQIRYLRSLVPSMGDDLECLRVRIALGFASQVVPSSARFQRSAARNLEFQLRRQILADGGHVSRNPDVVPGLLADLLPLAQCYVSASRPVPGGIIRAIDRMLPALRFFRHGDGHIAMFHGAGGNNMDLAAAVLRHDHSDAQPLGHMPHSGYQRLAAGGTTIIADTGKPPSGSHASNGHASCLAFEMSSGRQRIIVNSGIDRLNRSAYRDLARMTAAHSTLVLENTSSARYARFGTGGSKGRMRLVSGPATLRINRSEDRAAPGFAAQHDGYVRGFGLWHERGLSLQDDGATVDGYDRLIESKAKPRTPHGDRHFDIRFHLHPAVRAEKVTTRMVRLMIDQGEHWEFSLKEGEVFLEDSIHFAGTAGPVKSLQIVVPGQFPETEIVEWTVSRL
jgi:uncharacterized heparinase superfamily protein